MKICILSRSTTIYSTRRLVEAAIKRGHEVDVVNPLKCYMNISASKPEIHFNGKNLPHYDAVIPRIGASVTFYGTAVVRQFEMMGTYVLNESQAISRSRDKLRSLQLLSGRGIGMPITGFAHAPGDTNDLIKLVGGAPIVLKLLEGTQGVGVVLAETKKAAESVIDAFRGLKTYFLAQEYIKEAKASDIRLFVIGNKVVATMMRKGKEGDFRSNLHRGGTASTVQITAEEKKTAILSAQILGLRVAGVDILRSNRGPMVMEVNSSPGLKGIESTTGQDIADEIIKYIEKNAKPVKKISRHTG
jgi:ribosomal protein S6--L-glutamate ligase